MYAATTTDKLLQDAQSHSCYCDTAIAEGSGDAIWNVNPTALLMNAVAVACLTESVPMPLSANSKVASVLGPSVQVMKEITHAGCYTNGCETSNRYPLAFTS